MAARRGAARRRLSTRSPAGPEPRRAADAARAGRASSRIRCKAFFRQRLSVYFETDDPATDDDEPFELGRARALAVAGRADPRRSRRPRARRGRHPPSVQATLAAIARGGELSARRIRRSPRRRAGRSARRALRRAGGSPRAVAGRRRRRIELRFEHAVEGERIEVADWLGGLRRAAAAARRRALSAAWSSKPPRWSTRTTITAATS